jgi:hypothetical protein
MKTLSVLILFTLFSFKTERKDYWALVGTVNDFTELKAALSKDTANKKLVQWIDYKLQRIQK